MALTTLWAEELDGPLILNDRAFHYHLPDNVDPLPERPSNVGPIFDPVKNSEPLAPFTQSHHDHAFGPPSQIDSETHVPKRPANFQDPYLYPTLTRNEYTRLNLLWYYTRGIEQDQEMLKRLNRMLDLIKQSLGWEVGIVGLLDAATFTRLVTANLPLGVLPRRESTCAHTINQNAGTVFMITDMSKDWRFQHSPHVEIGGLRSYAGTQLRLPLAAGEDAVFGSLCVASMTVQDPLADEQKKTLIQAADMITSELVTRTRLLRLREKQAMMDALDKLRASSESRDFEASAIQILAERYPSCTIQIITLQQNVVELTRTISIPLRTVKNGAWEDAEYIKAKALSAGRIVDPVDRPVRAMISTISPNERALVVSTNDIEFVFDGIDTWFVDQCAQKIGAALQARALKEALAAKEKFLRTITHELRTPIHGILSTVELMDDEFKARSALQATATPELQESAALLNSFLQTIRLSGTELMTTVNNILRLNSSTHALATSYPTDYDLRCIEADVLGEVLTNYSEDQLQGLSIRFEHSFGHGQATVRIDADLLKELLKCLVVNAVAATPYGVIRVISSSDPSGLLRFDVIDTGVGIDEADHERIFLPFEKLDVHSKGAGLGLSLATQMAATLQGKLSLVSSPIGKGSHFRFEIPHVETVSNSFIPLRQWSVDGQNLPSFFHVITNSERDLHLLSHLESHLLQRRLWKSDRPEGCLIIMNTPNPLQSYDTSQLQNLRKPHMVIVVSSISADGAFKSCLTDELGPHCGIPLTGPLFTSRLDDVLAEAVSAFAEHCRSLTETCGSSSWTTSLAPSSKSTESTPPLTPCVEFDRSNMASAEQRSLKALLVDDNSVNLNVLQFFCKKRNIPYGTAVNGHKAFSSFCAGITADPYSLILLDLQMPECDGVEACKQIREYERSHNLQPSIILMITGQDSVKDRKNSFDAGVDNFFVKPVSLKKLDQTITQYFPHFTR